VNTSGIAENVLAAIIAAALLTLVLRLYSWLRNLRLEAQLKEAIDPNGVGVGFDPTTLKPSFTLQIHNYANATVRVRGIVFIADKFRIELKPAEPQRLFQTPLSNEIARPTFKRTHFTKGSLEPDNNPLSMLLPPKTMGIWEVEPDVIGKFEWIINKIYIVFEYATVFGNSALVRMEAREGILKLVKDNFEYLAKAVHTGQPPYAPIAGTKKTKSPGA